MRRLFNGALIVSFFLVVTTFVACSDDEPIEEITETIPSQPGEDEEENENENENDEPMERNLTITINGTAFTATLSDNDAATCIRLHAAYDPQHERIEWQREVFTTSTTTCQQTANVREPSMRAT